MTRRGGIFSRLVTRSTSRRRRRIIIGLKSDNSSREMLLRLLHSIVVPGDNVLAFHVQQNEYDDTFDPNTFHIHEDLCKSKQVDFEVKLSTGSCYITELSHQVRITFATILAIGCSTNSPDNSMIAKCLKALPPTCKLLILNYGGKILFQKMGTSQQGSSSGISRSLRPSLSESGCCDKPETRPVRKSFSLPSPSTGLTETPDRLSSKSTSTQQLYESSPAFSYRCFTFEELNRATQSFGPHMLISEGAGCQVYRAILENGQAASVKVLKTSIYSEDAFFREVEILSVLKHENIVLLLGYCRCKQLRAIVHNLLNSSLEQRLHQLKWHERMQVALGVAKALNYLHSCRPPIIHKAVKLSNILLSEDFKPQLSGFGAANAHASASRSPARKKSTCVAGTIGYLAPEYIMYGKVDEKLDVYSYGVVLLELITGKDAFRTVSLSNGESFSLWARSLLDRDTYEHLIDPNLKGDYKKDEMKTMITAAQCCLLHSPTRRPTMKTILHFLEDPNCMDLSQTGNRR